MAISYCKSFLRETLQAVHDFDNDVCKMALYTSDAGLDQDTTAYSTTNEISSGSGYTAGGNTLTAVSGYPQFEDGGWALRFEDTQWIFSVVKSDVRYVLIYNSSKANRGILSIDMGNQFEILGTFNWYFPLTAPPVIWQKAPGIT